MAVVAIDGGRHDLSIIKFKIDFGVNPRGGLFAKGRNEKRTSSTMDAQVVFYLLPRCQNAGTPSKGTWLLSSPYRKSLASPIPN